jgi:hypothetical protein
MLAIGLFSAIMGCQNLDMKKAIPFISSTDETDPRPVKLVATWKDTSLFRGGSSPSRGFGGRLYFYNQENEPIKVDGQLVVYAFEDKPGRDDSAQPDRKFVITPEHFVTHFSAGSVGTSYSVWLPWDAVGGAEKKINLIPAFLSRDGQVIVGNEGRQLLPDGKAPMSGASRPGTLMAVRPVSYGRSPKPPPASGGVDVGGSHSTVIETTIPIPWSM